METLLITQNVSENFIGLMAQFIIMYAKIVEELVF